MTLQEQITEAATTGKIPGLLIRKARAACLEIALDGQWVYDDVHDVHIPFQDDALSQEIRVAFSKLATGLEAKYDEIYGGREKGVLEVLSTFNPASGNDPKACEAILELCDEAAFKAQRAESSFDITRSLLVRKYPEDTRRLALLPASVLTPKTRP